VGSFEELRVLDAFAGSGALGFEALSRGAAFLLAIESNPKAVQLVEDNFEMLAAGGKPSAQSPRNDARLGNVAAQPFSSYGDCCGDYDDIFRLYRGDIFKVAPRLAGMAFDLGFFDPPYDMPASKLRELLDALRLLKTFSLGAIIVIERAKTKEPEDLLPEGYALLATKSIGDSSLTFASFNPEVGTRATLV